MTSAPYADADGRQIGFAGADGAPYLLFTDGTRFRWSRAEESPAGPWFPSIEDALDQVEALPLADGGAVVDD